MDLGREGSAVAAAGGPRQGSCRRGKMAAWMLQDVCGNGGVWAESSSWRHGLVRGSFWAAKEVFMLAVIFGSFHRGGYLGSLWLLSATISRAVVMIRTAFVAATGSLGVAAKGLF